MTYRDDQEALHARVGSLEGELAEERARREQAEQELEAERRKKTDRPPRKKKRGSKAKPRTTVEQAAVQPGWSAQLPVGRILAALALLAITVVHGAVAWATHLSSVPSWLWGADAAGAVGYGLATLLVIFARRPWWLPGLLAAAVGIVLAGVDRFYGEGWRAVLGLGIGIAATPLLVWDEQRRPGPKRKRAG